MKKIETIFIMFIFLAPTATFAYTANRINQFYMKMSPYQTSKTKYRKADQSNHHNYHLNYKSKILRLTVAMWNKINPSHARRRISHGEAIFHARVHFTHECISQIPKGIYFVEKRKRPQNRGLFFFLAPRTGLEPVTSWLTVMRSTDWATEEYCVGLALSSRTASSRVFSAPHSLTSVFGMGTGGPCALWRPTM